MGTQTAFGGEPGGALATDTLEDKAWVYTTRREWCRPVVEQNSCLTPFILEVVLHG